MSNALFKSAIFAAAVFGSGTVLIAHAEQHLEPYEVERSASGDIEFNSGSAEAAAAALSAESGVEALATDKSTQEADKPKQSTIALSRVRSD